MLLTPMIITFYYIFEFDVHHGPLYWPDLMVALFVGSFIHLSVFNDLILCPHIISRYFNLTYRLPSPWLEPVT
jgi:uncharacterized membrane protein YadS